MAEQRRKWRDKLKEDCFAEKSPKKAKIQILHQEVYKEQKGKLVLLSSLDYCNNNDDGQLEGHKGEKLQNLCMPLPLENETVTTPVQKLKDNIPVQNLTPTFRNPESYLAATAQFLKEISPKFNETQENPKSKLNQACSIRSDTNNTTNIEENNNFDDLVLNISSTIEEHTTEVELDNFSCFNIKGTVACDTNDDREISHNTFTVEVCIESGVHEEEKLEEIKKNERTMAANKTIKSVEETINNETKKKTDERNGAILNENADEIVSTIDSESAGIVIEENVEKKETVKRSRRKLNFNKSYLDFIAEDDPDTLILNEAFPSEESNLELSEETASSSDSECNNSKKGKFSYFNLFGKQKVLT